VVQEIFSWIRRYQTAGSSANTSGFDVVFRFGAPGSHWLPVAGDWDPATGTFLLKNLLQRGPADVTSAFGAVGSGQVPLAGERWLVFRKIFCDAKVCW